jgi:hypothetical protein
MKHFKHFLYFISSRGLIVIAVLILAFAMAIIYFIQYLRQFRFYPIYGQTYLLHWKLSFLKFLVFSLHFNIMRIEF